MQKNYRLGFTFALAALLMTGCHHDNPEFSTRTMADSLCLYYSDGPDDPWPLYEKNSYSVAWPAAGTLSAAAQRELMGLCFDDSAAASVEDAAQRWLRRIWFTDDESLQGEVIGAIADTIEHSYIVITVFGATVTLDGFVAFSTFCIQLL